MVGLKGKDRGDVTPLDTLKRELNEELLSPDWVNAIQEKNVIDDSKLGKTLYNTTSLPAATVNTDEGGNTDNFEDGRFPGTVRYLGTTLHSHTAKLIDKPDAYAFFCALYEITIGIDQLPHSILHPVGATVQEGRLALLTQDQLLQQAGQLQEEAQKLQGLAMSRAGGRGGRESATISGVGSSRVRPTSRDDYTDRYEGNDGENEY